LKNEAAIDEDILAYLAENQEARDTFEGIVEWWLLKQRINQAVSEVKAALGRLVAQKLVATQKGRDGRIHYRLSRVPPERRRLQRH
jgi:hypothetical protein